MQNILRVDMTAKAITSEKIPEMYAKLGGRMLTSRIIRDEVPADCDPLGDSNKLVIAAGLLAGTPAPCSGRLSIGAKSPLTGTIKESNAGGVAAQKLAKSGIRAVVLEGKAEGPFILVINGTKGELLDAKDYVGMGNYQLVNELSEKYGNRNAYISVGPAGEMGLRAACIANNDPEGRPSRMSGRGGLGAVMGTKGLKAIVVMDAKEDNVNYADKKAFMDNAKAAIKAITDNPGTKGFTDYGTAALVNKTNTLGCLPTRNFSEGVFEGADKISGETVRETIIERQGSPSHRCMAGCVIACSNIYPDENGKEIVAPLEYETIGLMGSNLGIDDLDMIAELNYVCNDIGIDTIDTGAALGVAMEAGILEFGDGPKALKAIKSITERHEVLGRLLGNGAEITGKVLGVKRIPTVKGQAMPAYDPRGLKGLGVTYATSPMGADHTAGTTLRAPVDHRNPAVQAPAAQKSQRTVPIFDTLGLCMFSMGGLMSVRPVLVDMLNSRYGWTFTDEDLTSIGTEVLRIERSFNKSAGFTAKDDRLPEYFTKEVLPAADTVFDVPDEQLDWVNEDLD